MKYIHYAFLAVILLLCVMLALANRGSVTLAVWPDTMSAFLGFGYSVTLPLFVIVGGAAGLGLVIGLIWEWLREHGQRVETAALRREVAQLRAATTTTPTTAVTKPEKPKDQVLAILDEADSPR
ncbi:LapA family protein [Pararhodobacter sp.]|uniref:LapA family protein n=1 Tax=Pararhodobacter sp. TaxID=2127056 RepID=UPI002AFECC05|nr:LapA family protein [Pararhodobacter sp.]